MRQPRHSPMRRNLGDLDLFVSNAKERQRVQQLQTQVKTIIQECFPDTETFVAHMEGLSLPVLYIAHAPLMLKIALWVRNIEDGFLVPSTPGYDEILADLIRCCPDKAPMDFDRGVLVVRSESYHFTFLAYEFYHWMAFTRGLKGYEYPAQQFYKIFSEKYQRQLNPKMLEKMTLKDKKLLRYAIRREKEALQFLKSIVDEVFIPANNAQLLEGGSAQA